MVQSPNCDQKVIKSESLLHVRVDYNYRLLKIRFNQYVIVMNAKQILFTKSKTFPSDLWIGAYTNKSISIKDF